MSDRIKEIRDRWAAATPAPWCVDYVYDDCKRIVPCIGRRTDKTEQHGPDPITAFIGHPGLEEHASNADVTAIAASPGDIAFLLGEEERLQEALTREQDQSDRRAERARRLELAAKQLQRMAKCARVRPGDLDGGEAADRVLAGTESPEDVVLLEVLSR